MERTRAFGLAAALLLASNGCYLSTAAWEQAKILSARRPIAEIVRDGRVPVATRAKLQLVLEARDFAARDLGLNTGKSFTAFTQIERDTLVLVVTAAYADTLRPYTWWFPIVGRVPYKGHFNFDAARAEARELLDQGLDVYLRPADAYSTLGWFNDPLLSTTLSRDSVELVNTVVHELTHNTFYAPGAADFNESFASFVGARGSVNFFRARGDEAMARVAEARWQDEQLLAGFWRRLAIAVDSALRAHPPGEQRRAARDSVYGRARTELVEQIGPRFLVYDRRYGHRVVLNNAVVLARRVYGKGFDLFEAVHLCEGRALSATIRRVTALASKSGGAPFDSLAAWVRQPTCEAQLRAAAWPSDSLGL